MSGWETLDVSELLKRNLPEETTSGNVGSYQVPLGKVQRRAPVSNIATDTDFMRDVPDVYKEALGIGKKKK